MGVHGLNGLRFGAISSKHIVRHQITVVKNTFSCLQCQDCDAIGWHQTPDIGHHCVILQKTNCWSVSFIIVDNADPSSSLSRFNDSRYGIMVSYSQ